jgi:hypothetical protein
MWTAFAMLFMVLAGVGDSSKLQEWENNEGSLTHARQ